MLWATKNLIDLIVCTQSHNLDICVRLMIVTILFYGGLDSDLFSSVGVTN